MSTAWERHADAAIALLDRLLVEIDEHVVPLPMAWLRDPCQQVTRALRKLSGDARTTRRDEMEPMQLNNLGRRGGDE